MECISSISYSLTENGGLSTPFPGKMGIRQEDPMSPYLFVIAMEYLQRELSLLKLQKDFKYHPRCKKLNVVHICFADDLLMFYKTDIKSVQLLQSAFKRFSVASRLEANNDKSSVYMTGFKPELKQAILDTLGLTEEEIPFRYLGVTLSSKKLTIAQCLPLGEKIIDRMRYWSAKLLSYAGRIQLIQYVVFGVQTYWSQNFVLPKRIFKMIDSICRTFLWTGSVSTCRKSRVSWAKMCTPRAAGGQNILNLYLWNQAAILKQLWVVHCKKDYLWIK
ncbi:uncharacterized protein LOC132619835 [Lycium barbarum]|uniref:uncharacterized protein LOC132619835 n=1 Tax=Lycium barbarum TaxID=112863 RepID=UPI00293F7120|nr:uncharacterized protein LOC132619835 [Lycium barbarum]